MDKRVALVTGSARGMGRAIAEALAGVCGAVAVHYRSDAAGADETVRSIRMRGAGSEAFPADLSDAAGAAALVGSVEKAFGRLDILVNNVGPFLVKAWHELEAGDWEAILRVNLLAAFATMKAALPGMRSRGWGRIVNIGYSRAEQLGAFPTIAPYAVAKTGLVILTRTAAKTEARHGITVNLVSPGLIRGGAMPPGKTVDPETLGGVEDVAAAVLGLAGEDAGKITGTNVLVAGTWKM
ncbi:MAG: SDR family oxidoreductase [Candidatus Aminicenantes bacterium]|nr:SDR family oxidoreductase [Candidatus Aminicenantes bacterium]